MNIIPNNDKLVVKRDEAEKTVGSIIIPDAHLSPVMTGTILAVGPKCDEELKPGQRILFDKRANVEYKDLLILNTRDVYFIFNE